MNLRDLLPGRRPTMTRTDKPFGYAVVGLGHIAEYFLKALGDSRVCAVTALVSGDAAKARLLATKYQVPLTLSYREFDQLREHSQVDAVYLALPVSMHREFTGHAAAAGKHVLCEKPMASTAVEARAMTEACAAANVRLSIAYRCPHTFIHQRARYLVQAGLFGTKASLRLESGFGFPLGPGWRDDAALAGGGSLYDVGIYPLNAARFLLAEEPCGVENAQAVCDNNGLERSIRWTSVFPSGARAHCASSYQRRIVDTLRVSGELGSVLMAPSFSHRERHKMRGELRNAAGETVRISERTPSNAASEFRLEAEALANAVTKGEPLLTPGEDGLADMVAMEAIYAAAGVSLP